MDTLVLTSEVTDAQEDLVRLNLRIKSLVESFAQVETYADMEELNSEIRSQLELMRTGITSLRVLASKQKYPDSMAMLNADADKHEDQMASCNRRFKSANISCIAKLDKRGRDALLSSPSDMLMQSGNQRRKLKDKVELVSQEGKATDQLSAISRNLAATVERSARTIEELAESSSTMKDASEEFKSMGAVIGLSGKLISKYARRENTDRVLILFAASFFFGVVFYILRKRVFGPFDPFVFIWNSITTFITYLINVLTSDPTLPQEIPPPPDTAQAAQGGLHGEL